MKPISFSAAPHRTRVRVRGKKKRVRPTHLLVSGRSSLDLRPKSKGPLSPAGTSALNLSPTKIRHLGRNPESRTPRRFGSSLERLPIEVLELIFFNCLNISLPQASPLIGHKLASHYVKSQLVFRVFASGYGLIDASSIAPICANAQQRQNLRAKVLDLRWLTLSFLRRIIPEFLCEIIIRELGARKLGWMGSGPVVTRKSESAIRRFLESNATHEDDWSGPDWLGNWPTNWPAEDDPLETISIRLALLEGRVALRRTSKQCTVWMCKWDILRLIAGCKIPQKLLHGPWTPEKCEFLELLIDKGAIIDWVGSTHGEIAEQGFHEALDEGNIRAVRALIFGNHMRCMTGIIPRTEHLRKVVFEKDCQIDLVETLVQARESRIEAHDRKILDWTVRAEHAGDDRGVWLRGLLEVYGK